MIFLKIAFLNLVKHKRRSLLVIGVVGISVILMQFVTGMLDGISRDFYSRVLKDSGHIQIHTRGYKESLNPYSLDLLMPDPGQLIEKAEKTIPLTSAESFIQFGGLMVSNEKNIQILGVGLDPGTTYYADVRKGMTDGDFLPGGEGILVSRGIQKLLDAKTGDFAAILVEDAEGNPYYLDYRITGIYETGFPQIDDYYIFMSKANADDLLYARGGMMEIRLTVENPDDAEVLTAALAPVLEKAGAEGSSWVEIHGSFVKVIKLFDLFIIFMNILVIIVAGAVITNTILMTIFEKLRELGTMRAIGLKKRQMFSLILSEGITGGVAGGLLGLLIGIPLVLFLQRNGLEMGEAMSAFGLGTSMPFAFTWKSAGINLLSGILIACAGSLYAASVGAKMKLTELLKFV